MEALRSPNTGPTYTQPLQGKGSNLRLIEKDSSYYLGYFFRGKGYENEYQYVNVIAQWHESSDGRGISQLKRSQDNYEMLNYILDEWMPWHKDDCDFSKDRHQQVFFVSYFCEGNAYKYLI